MPTIQALAKDTLSESPSSPGITRHLAFKGEDYLVLRSRTEPGTVSGWHHHGDHEVYGYVASGSASFETGPGGTDAVFIGSGGFFHVPPNTVHREINPSATEGNEVILFLVGTGPLVDNVEGPDHA
jgi:quercetin dioxygenase-like cupin family protein